jgi:hypothetical protein
VHLQLSSSKLQLRQQRRSNMPVKKVKGGYKWGSTGKVYPTKAEAEKQGKAIYASGYKKKGTK